MGKKYTTIQHMGKKYTTTQHMGKKIHYNPEHGETVLKIMFSSMSLHVPTPALCKAPEFCNTDLIDLIHFIMKFDHHFIIYLYFII